MFDEMEPYEDDLLAYRERELDEDAAAGEFEWEPFDPDRCPGCGGMLACLCEYEPASDEPDPYGWDFFTVAEFDG